MKCEKWQEQILLRASGELSGRKLSRLERHLERCVECRRFAEEYVAASNALDSLGVEEPSAAALARVRTAMEERKRPTPVFGVIPRLAVAGAAAAALVAIALVVSSRQEPVPPAARATQRTASQSSNGVIAVGEMPEGVVDDAEIEDLLAWVSEEVELLGEDVALSTHEVIGSEIEAVEEALDQMRLSLEET